MKILIISIQNNTLIENIKDLKLLKVTRDEEAIFFDDYLKNLNK